MPGMHLDTGNRMIKQDHCLHGAYTLSGEKKLKNIFKLYFGM